MAFTHLLNSVQSSSMATHTTANDDQVIVELLASCASVCHN